MLSLNRQSLSTAIFGDRDFAYFWDRRFLPRWLPLLLGLSLGMIVAFLIVDAPWPFSVAVALMVPLLVLFLRYPFAAVIIWILVFPFFANGASAADRYLHWVLHRGMIPAALGTVILSNWLGARKREPVPRGLAAIAMLIFLGLVLASALLSARSLRSPLYKIFDRIFVPFCTYWLVTLTAPKKKDLKILLWAALVIVVSQSVIGLLAWFAPQVLPSKWLGLAGERTVGTLRNVAVYTSTLIFFSLLLFQYGINCKVRWRRLALLLVFGLALFCVFFSFSRGSWLGCSLVLVGLAFLYPKVVLRLTIGLALLVYVLSGSVLAEHVTWGWERLTGDASRSTAESRMITNNASLRMIEAKPVWGWGYGNYDLYDRQFQTRVADIAVAHDGTSHNTYLTIVAENGLVAFFFYILPVGWWFVLSIKVWRRLPRDGFWSRQLLAMLWFSLAHIFIVSSFMDMVRNHPFGTTVCWMALGFVANLVYPYLKPGDAEMDVLVCR